MSCEGNQVVCYRLCVDINETVWWKLCDDTNGRCRLFEVEMSTYL